MPRKNVLFSVKQVQALCGGRLPQESGFDWGAVDHFCLEGGVLQPYLGEGEILPEPGIAVKTSTKSLGGTVYLIQGMFFQRGAPIPYFSYSFDGTIVTMTPIVKFAMFSGMFGPDSEDRSGSDGRMVGRMQDYHGHSVLIGVSLTSRYLSFSKFYDVRENPIDYRFKRGDDGIWKGSFKGKGVKRGDTWCVLTEVPASITEPRVYTKK